ncbi:Tat pathway signal sequence domain protein (Modular protein) [Planktothrix tepida]|uniref:Tat pathway signal sequence domain protein (Modular protein) n=1 Tax=Planktothrix tepida PCC 9214 TaxID=671072 RepID=A0A1J1LHF0_9CYAN|nr:phosphodiester glycosidase family protein [Planktothrix tepida]CAD5948325.1 Tat pathway signal sequence domain protein (Modular protein) [Planktothrix tepida]CUR31907.1 Tat pathway signal sequence domain protein (Modular protein) [Planktothrix tepida PCC 9214]
MPNAKKQKGCQTMARRTFLLFIGFLIFRALKGFFSIAENRDRTLQFINQIKQTYFSERFAVNSPTPQPAISPPTIVKTPTFNLPTSQPLIIPNSPSPNLNLNSVQPVQILQKDLLGISFYQTIINLTDPENIITMGLANNAPQANSSQKSYGDESFTNFVKRYPAAVVANGTFFSKDAQKRVMGNLVGEGKFLKYSRWENFGTTLGLKTGNRPEMITARLEGKPEWNQHWFSLTCGPRLIKQGKIWLAPKTEGFNDPHVLDKGYRTAIGFSQTGKELFLVSFLASLTLQQEAEVMKAIGCYEAMNLDGGASEGLAYHGDIYINPGRNLTNVIVVYDRNFPAPSPVKTAWKQFQNGQRPVIPINR